MDSNVSGPSVDQQLQHELEGHDLDSMMEQSTQVENTPPSHAASQSPGEDSEAGDTGEQPSPGVQPQHHEFRRGRISAIRGDDIFVDLPGDTGKMQGVVPASQFDRPPRIGSIMDFVVDHIDESQGLVFLSREGAISRATWEQLQKGAAVEARCISKNKGGLELEMIGGIRAFMPASQVDIHHVGDLEPFVGQRLEGVVQDIDRKSKKVVLSRRLLLEQRKEAAKEKLLAELEPGQQVKGTVVSIVEYGAFIDLGGVDGLLHVSDMSHGHVNKPAEVVTKGQELDLKVLKIDPEKGRISLGLKQVQPDPWEKYTSTLEVGSQITGTVTRTAQFGAFVELEPGVDGLLPMSELSWKRIHKADEVVKVGEQVRATVIGFDPEKRRLTLSLKQTTGDPWTGAEHRYSRESQVEGKVLSTTDFGAFVEIEAGLEGLVHISELAPHRVGQVTDVVQAGDVKSFRILEVDEENRKIRLSLKPAPEVSEQAEQAPADDRSQKPGAAKRKKRRDSLKGGMEGGGIGLGNISLDDF